MRECSKGYVACYAFGKRRAPLGPLGEETTAHVGQPGFSLGYTLCRSKVSRRIKPLHRTRPRAGNAKDAESWPLDCDSPRPAASKAEGQVVWTCLSPQATGERLVSFLVSFMFVYLRLSPSTTVF